MVGGRTERSLERLPALHPQVKVVLPGEADPAVALESLGVGDRLGLGRNDLCDRRRERAVGQVRGQRERGVPGRGARRFHAHVRARKLVLHRLERADRLSELLARLHMLQGHVEHPHRDPVENGGHGGRSTIERACGRSRQPRVRAGTRLDGEQSPGAVVGAHRRRGERVAGHRVKLAVPFQQQKVGVAGVDRERRSGELHRHDRLAGGDARQPVAAGFGQDRRRDRERLDERLGQRRPPGFLEHEHQIHRVGDLEQPRLAERLPHGSIPLGAAPQLAQPRRRRLLLEELAREIPDGELLVGEIEIHRGYFRGRPSTRSAMMLRWISLVPA
jgi:hypothetical protein